MRRCQNPAECDAGEIASWLILAVGLCAAAVAAVTILVPTVEQLALNVGPDAVVTDREPGLAEDPAPGTTTNIDVEELGLAPANPESDVDPRSTGTTTNIAVEQAGAEASGPDLELADPNGRLAQPEVNPAFASRVELVIADLQAQGYHVIVHTAYRSGEEQNRLYCQSRTTGICAGTGVTGARVTGAQAGESWHNYGLAADLVVRTPNGGPSWPDPDPFWDALGDAADRHGLVWGGGSGDRPHVEYHPGTGDGFSSAGDLKDVYAEGGLESVWDEAGAAN